MIAMAKLIIPSLLVVVLAGVCGRGLRGELGGIAAVALQARGLIAPEAPPVTTSG